MVQVAEKPAQQAGPVEEPSSVPGLTQSSFQSHLVYGRGNTPSEGCAVSKIQTGPLNTVVLSWLYPTLGIDIKILPQGN